MAIGTGRAGGDRARRPGARLGPRPRPVPTSENGDAAGQARHLAGTAHRHPRDHQAHLRRRVQEERTAVVVGQALRSVDLVSGQVVVVVARLAGSTDEHDLSERQRRIDGRRDRSGGHRPDAAVPVLGAGVADAGRRGEPATGATPGHRCRDGGPTKLDALEHARRAGRRAHRPAQRRLHLLRLLPTADRRAGRHRVRQPGVDPPR